MGNSHTFINSLYALDLKTPKNTDPDAITSGVSGVAYVYKDCIEHNTKCGNGWGNHVRILTASGLVVQYAHLEKVWVRHGQFVNIGTNVGLEGTTGLTGYNNRHLHMSVHYNKDFNKNKFFLGELPKSIPFKMNICQLEHGTCNGTPIDIRELKCTRVTKKREWVQTFKF